VAGGQVTLGTAGDGGGSIRIPAGFTGMVGLKVTYGRIPKGPHHEIGSLTAVPGCISRSVRDTARWLDVSNGHDSRDPLSLPRVEGWEAGLGSSSDALRGMRVAVLPAFGGAVVAPDVVAVVEDLAAWLTDHLGLRRHDVDVRIPSMGTAWSLAGLIAEFASLGERWPACEGELTPEIRHGMRFAEGRYGIPARIRLEQRRTELFEAMAGLFDEVDLVVCATNPDVAFAAEGPLPDTFGGLESTAANNGKLTIPGNIYGNPGISIPQATSAGSPSGSRSWLATTPRRCSSTSPSPSSGSGRGRSSPRAPRRSAQAGDAASPPPSAPRPPRTPRPLPAARPRAAPPAGRARRGGACR
jgi:aspartyl-tRNA(Asn)/glutamyl-tRNA(Gln) amidotransferase subunit A